jgi:hypothetical protein
LWREKATCDPEKFSAYIVGNGSIVPWKHTDLDPNRVNGEIFCHWISDEEWDDDSDSSISTNSVQPVFSGMERLLIGAQDKTRVGKRTLEVNSSCGIAISTAREHLKDLGRISVLGTAKPMRYNDCTQYQLHVGYSAVNAPITKQYKRVSGRPLKDVLIKLWAMEPDISPALLDDLYGLEVSLHAQCSANIPLISPRTQMLTISLARI